MRTLLIACFSLLTLSLYSQGDCEINELVAEAHPCSNGMFFVDIDFIVVAPQGDTFGIVGNATDYGFFDYDSLPVTLGPLVGDETTEWEFIVYDAEEPNCQATVVLGIVNCCSITDVVVDPDACTNPEEYNATLNFNFSNTGGVGFDVFDENENSLGFFSYDDLPVTVEGIPSNGAGADDVLIICDNDNPNCCTEVVFEGPDCNPDDCEIYNVEAVAGACENGSFLVTINFTSENTGPGFTVTGNGNNYGTFAYDSLPVVVGPVEGDSITVYEFVITDLQNGECQSFTVIDPVSCPPACHFEEVNVDPIACQGDSSYSIGINFIPVNPEAATFVVTSGGINLGTFSYESLPIVIDSFPASGAFNDVLTIHDSEDSTCTAVVEFQALLCEGCLIYDLVVETTPCDSNGQFFVDIDFLFQNTGPMFQVGGNGNIYGQFSYDELPITLGPFDGDTVTFYEFVVLDLENAFCLEGFELGLVDCITPCEIGPLTVDPLECSGTGTYDLFLDFETTNTGGLGFDVFAGDDFVGFYLYGDLPVTVEDFPSSGNANDVITVCDNDNTDCCSTLEFPSLTCVDTCDIFDLVVDVDECTSEVTFGAFINFEHMGFASNSVDVFANEVFIGFFNIDSLPIYVAELPATGGGINVTVCANDQPDCCATVEIQSPECDTMLECSIFDIVVDPVECGGDDTFFAFINFEHEGLTSSFVNISTDGIDLGEYHVDSLPVLVDGIPGDGSNTVITICDNDNPECCGIVEFETLDCDTVECAIFDIVIDGQECGNDGTFSMFVNFEHEGLTSSTVNISAAGIDLGNYLVDSLPVLVDGIPGDGSNTVLTICDNDNPDCCGFLEFETPNCDTSDCSIFDIVLDPIECAPNGTFFASINFEHSGLTSSFVNMSVGGENLGIYHVDSLPVLVDGIPGTGANAVLTICDNDNPECCGILEFETLACDTMPCTISDLAVTVLDCDTVGSFGILVSFEHEGLTNEFVEVWSGDEFLGFFAYDPLPIFISGVPATGEVENLTVCENDNDGCCATIEYQTPLCDTVNICEIFEVVVDPQDCDSNGTFSALVTFEHVGLTNDFVEMWTGNIYLGLFAVDSMPILVDGIPGDGQNAPLTICQNDNADCCTTVEFETLDCGIGDCIIDDVSATISDCDSLDQFFVTLNFGFQNVGNSGFSVIGNGENYGAFSYDDVPITLGPFDGDGETEWEFAVIDNGDPNCSGFTEVGIVECSTSGIGSLQFDIAPLKLFQHEDGVRFDIPQGALSVSAWSVDGRRVHFAEQLNPGESMVVKSPDGISGLLFIQVIAEQKLYVGKAFVRGQN